MNLNKFRQNRDRLKKHVNDESGQSIILISVVILSFLMFFQFAVSTGLLINAKISVQTAADAAAYAGAAVQARQLNAISFLNYDMRRQYKKFMYRYVYAGAMGDAVGCPPLGNGDFAFCKNDDNHPIATIVPSVCIPFTALGKANTNCQSVSLHNTTAGLSSGGGINQIQDQLIASLTQIANVQNEVCQAQGDINFAIALIWLFNANTSSNTINSILAQLAAAKTSSGQPAVDLSGLIAQLGPLTKGLGLYPRNMINLMRIHSLEGFINQAPETGITSDSISGWEKGADSEARERTIQAFQSALANLNGSIFNSSEVSMDELQSTPMLTINDLKVSFNVYVQHANPNFKFSSASEVACSQSIDAFPAIAAPVSVTAKFNPNVAYAVHLKAFVKKRGILYLPNTEDLELDAYAGAKPFGSRIGPVNPPAAAKDFVKPLTPGTTLVGPITPAGGAAGNNVPYLEIDNSTDFYSTSFFTALNAIAKTGATSFTGPSIAAGQIQAIAPWMKEVGHYSIIPPIPTTATDAGSIHAAMAYDFIPYANPPDASGNNIYRFYAPIFPNSGSDITSTISNMIDSIFGKVQVGTSSNPFNFSTYDMGVSLKTQIKTYIDSLSAGGTVGENGETQTFAAIELPMPTTLKQGTFWLTKANQVLSSWGPSAVRENASDSFGFKPRFAYSVKFVTMQDLQSQGIGSEDDSDLSAVVH